eukprot:2361098-Pleurochrysis_carterae.AAC.2
MAKERAPQVRSSTRDTVYAAGLKGAEGVMVARVVIAHTVTVTNRVAGDFDEKESHEQCILVKLDLFPPVKKNESLRERGARRDQVVSCVTSDKAVWLIARQHSWLSESC